MPPLLAALLMIAFDCDLRIVQAIDLGMEWRCDWPAGRLSARECAEAWYRNQLGRRVSMLTNVGTYVWPSTALPIVCYESKNMHSL